MKNIFRNILQATQHAIFPHNCMGCQTDILDEESLLCAKCFSSLPLTHFFKVANNPIANLFYARLALQQAAAGYFFTKDGLMQDLLVQLKYKNNPEVGIYLGELIGKQMQGTSFVEIDAIVPLPLNAKKEFKRGYNQANLIAQGIAKQINKPIINNAVGRKIFTKTQTHEDRISRWENMQNVFEVTNPTLISNKHILLVDDVVTTGATLEACGTKILAIKGTKLSIACVAYTS